MIDRRNKDYEGGELYRLRTHRLKHQQLSGYTHDSRLFHSLKFCLLHSTIQLVLIIIQVHYLTAALQAHPTMLLASVQYKAMHYLILENNEPCSKTSY